MTTEHEQDQAIAKLQAQVVELKNGLDHLRWLVTSGLTEENAKKQAEIKTAKGTPGGSGGDFV